MEKGHKNETIHRARDVESESKLEFLLKQSHELYQAGFLAGETVTEKRENPTL